MTINNLAALLDDENRHAEAEPLYLRALAVQERTLGPEHPDTLTSLNNLAALYNAQGRYAEAERLQAAVFLNAAGGGRATSPLPWERKV